jgi:hypothetical protein
MKSGGAMAPPLPPRVRRLWYYGGRWRMYIQDHGNKLNPDGSDLLEVFQKVCTVHRKYLEESEIKLGLIKPIYTIFRSFCVFQWIIHLLVLASSFTFLTSFGHGLDADRLTMLIADRDPADL